MTERTAGGAKPNRGYPSLQFSLRAKGFIFILVLMVYGASLTLYGFYEKNKIFEEYIEKSESVMSRIDFLIGKLRIIENILELYSNIDLADLRMGSFHDRNHLDLMEKKITSLKAYFHGNSIKYQAIVVSYARSINEPTYKNLIAFRKTLDQVRDELLQTIRTEHGNRGVLVTEFIEKRTKRIVAWISFLGITGFVVTIILSVRFFSRLTSDMKTIEKNARAILEVETAGKPPTSTVNRTDEIGSLSNVLDRVAEEMVKHQKKLEIERKKLFHQDKMAAIGTLAAGIAHEVGNPISAIRSLLDRILKDQMFHKVQCENIKCRESLSFILEHTERLAIINREIAEFSTPQPSKLQLIDINSLVKSAANLMKYDKRCRKIDIKLDLDTQLPAVKAKGDQIMQVIMNLLINSADALAETMDKPASITISTAPDGDYITLAVRDNGHGMDKETMEHVFEAFYTTKPAGKGTGLGLSLCHSIMNDHQGKIEIESELLAGTTVRVVLPLVKQTQPALG